MSDETMRAEFEAGHTRPFRVQWCDTRGVYAATEATLSAEDEARNYTSMFYAFCAGKQAALAQNEQVGPKHPEVIRWRNDAIETSARIADAYGWSDAASDIRWLLTPQFSAHSQQNLTRDEFEKQWGQRFEPPADDASENSGLPK